MQKKKWDKLSENDLLQYRICDLNLSLKSSWVYPYIQKLYSELRSKKLRFRPHIWIADDWYTPDGIAGFAIPFYIVHPRLIKLERSMMMEAEGGRPDWLMKLLRHETGHAIDNAFHLRKRKKRQLLFGPTSQEYPEDYAPRPFSKKFVYHLDSWYAQAHPDEDWAETFAVWLTPRSAWKKRYEKWPAIKKLQLVDEIMHSIQRCAPINKEKFVDRTYKDIKSSLKNYYQKKMNRYQLDGPPFYAGDLYKIFSPDEKYQKNLKATKFIKTHRKDICKQVSRWTSQYQYTVNEILNDVIDFCQENKLYLKASAQKTKIDFIGMLTAQTMNYLLSGQHRIAM